MKHVFLQTIIRQIDRSMKHRDESLRGTMAKEIQKHMDLCAEQSNNFLGRENDLYRIKVYLTGSLRRSFVVHGQVGSGKTAFLSKIATSAKEWMRMWSSAKKWQKSSAALAKKKLPVIVIVRFLGTTPISSSKFSLLISICQQLCYNLEIKIEEIPQDFVPLKNYFNELLNKASQRFFTVILLGQLVHLSL